MTRKSVDCGTQKTVIKVTFRTKINKSWSFETLWTQKTWIQNWSVRYLEKQSGKRESGKKIIRVRSSSIRRIKRWTKQVPTGTRLSFEDREWTLGKKRDQNGGLGLGGHAALCSIRDWAKCATIGRRSPGWRNREFTRHGTARPVRMNSSGAGELASCAHPRGERRRGRVRRQLQAPRV